MQFAPYVVILLFLGRFEKLIIPYIAFLLSFIGLRRQTGQKVTAQTPDHCVQWSQTYDQKDKGVVVTVLILFTHMQHVNQSFSC